SAFASSGRATQLANGRLIFPLVVREDGNPDFKVYAVYTDDLGKTWKVSKNPATTDGDESKIVQLADGTV
ncbi:sialidase family protein, partial [uncultured Duncaniella sp.]